MILERDVYRCRVCGKAGPGPMEVDHLVPWFRAPHLEYEPSNLQTLCRPCHFRKSASERPQVSPERQAWRELVKQSLQKG